MTDRMQKFMDGAYDRWQKKNDWSKERFWSDLSAPERFSVFMGNLNYQVENGGFHQWHGNAYATPESVRYILNLTKEMGTPAALKVHDLVKKFSKIVYRYTKDFNQDHIPGDDWESFYEELQDTDLDGDFYKINAEFLAECEAYINKEWPENVSASA